MRDVATTITLLAGVATPADADALPVGDTRRYGHLLAARHRQPAAAATLVARRVWHAAIAVTRVANDRSQHLPEGGAHSAL